MLELLERESFDTKETDIDLDEELFTRCYNELGYKVADRVRQEEEINKILKSLDIYPFTNESVEKYKLKQMRCHDHSILFGCQFFVVCSAIIAISICLGLLVIPGFFFMLFLLIPEAILTIVLFENFTFKWEITSLQTTTLPIPEFALQTALDVHSALGASPHRLCIECLKKEVVVDPFLVLEVEDKRWYLEVWNEPAFKGKRGA